MAFLYWIRLPSHTDYESEGYIGVTSGSIEKDGRSIEQDLKTL